MPRETPVKVLNFNCDSCFPRLDKLHFVTMAFAECLHKQAPTFQDFKEYAVGDRQAKALIKRHLPGHTSHLWKWPKPYTVKNP